MTATIRLDGSAEFQSALRRMSDDVRRQVGEEVMSVALDMQADVKRSIARGSKTGRVYRRGNRTHQASAPGQAPASDTGRLVNSIEFDKLGMLSAAVGSHLVYALHLEYGTRKMAARPFFRPAVEKMRKQFQKRLEIAVQRATR